MLAVIACRFTPTGVGNTKMLLIFSAGGTVHPHGRGEYTFDSGAFPRPNGSPPLAWGIRPQASHSNVLSRFTPTGVGNTCFLENVPALATVHPHGRGEYVSSSTPGSAASGSPPRAWGILLAACHCPRAKRFTPTGVGNTNAVNNAFSGTAVHPHGRGEYNCQSQRNCRWCGSPPRAWGIPDLPQRPKRLCRFTPTGVGNTLFRHFSASGNRTSCSPS